MNYLSLCAIVKHEQLYLRDWIDFHKQVGAEHFYLYLNESLESDLYDLEDEQTGFCDILRWPGSKQQMMCYQHCLDYFREESRWIGFIDIDEYLVPHARADVRPQLKDYEDASALAIHWYLFGSNGHETWTHKPVVERFTHRQPDVNPHIKCIVNPKRTFKCFSPHVFVHDVPPVDENHTSIGMLNPLPERGTCNLFQINHYATKSREESYERRQRPRADNGKCHEFESFFTAHDRNEVVDLRAFEIWSAAKNE